MTPGVYDFDLYQGQLLEKSFVCSNAGTFVLGDYTCQMQIRLSPDSSVIWDSSDTDNGNITILNDTTMTLEIPATITAGMDFGEAQYDIELTHKTEVDSLGLPKKVKFIRGNITLIKEITE
jgi:hypothetical protein